MNHWIASQAELMTRSRSRSRVALAGPVVPMVSGSNKLPGSPALFLLLSFGVGPRLWDSAISGYVCMLEQRTSPEMGLSFFNSI